MRNPLGVYAYVGKTRSGKTVKAIDDAHQDKLQTGYPILAVDSRRDRARFGSWPRATSVAEVKRFLWGRRQSCAWTPNDEDEHDEVFDLILRGMCVHVIEDEAHHWISKRHIGKPVSKALREAEGGWTGSLRLTTQLPRDLHPACLGNAVEIYLFKTVTDFEYLPKDVDPVEVRALAVGKFLVVRDGVVVRE